MSFRARAHFSSRHFEEKEKQAASARNLSEVNGGEIVVKLQGLLGHLMNSSSNNPFYGTQGNLGSPLGMGSLQQNLSRGSSLVQLQSRNQPQNNSAVGGASMGGGANLMGFNSTVGGGRVTPTSSAASPFSSGLGNFSGSFGGQLSRQLGILPNNSMPSSSAVLGRSPLFGRERGKIGDSLSAFDPSEFPSLGSRENNSAPNPALSRSNYVGMVKQPAMEASEFTMSNEDFPALPGPGPISVPTPGVANASSSILDDLGASSQQQQPQQVMGGGGHLVTSAEVMMSSQAEAVQQQQQQQQQHLQQQQQQQQQQQNVRPRGIQTSPSGLVTNIPQSMVTDQFGMIGLLTFIRAAETDPNLVSLALGADLTTLGLNLNSEVNLYPTFGGPWAETPCRPQDIDYHVPYEYLTNTTIRDKLAPVKLNRYKDDVLFYMFYTNVGDVLQLAAAAELYNRDWRYHKEDRVWITRAPGMPPSEKTASYERGTYHFFDVNSWRRASKEFHLDYDKLEDRPSLPTNLSGQQLSGAPPSSGSPAPPMGGMHQPQISPNMPPPGGL